MHTHTSTEIKQRTNCWERYCQQEVRWGAHLAVLVLGRNRPAEIARSQFEIECIKFKYHKRRAGRSGGLVFEKSQSEVRKSLVVFGAVSKHFRLLLSLSVSRRMAKKKPQKIPPREREITSNSALATVPLRRRPIWHALYRFRSWTFVRPRIREYKLANSVLQLGELQNIRPFIAA